MRGLHSRPRDRRAIVALGEREPFGIADGLCVLRSYVLCMRQNADGRHDRVNGNKDHESRQDYRRLDRDLRRRHRGAGQSRAERKRHAALARGRAGRDPAVLGLTDIREAAEGSLGTAPDPTVVVGEALTR
jgi:hypothetical protein